jgi:hypothetical protein
MSPELELIDQLLGESLTLPVVCALFKGEGNARRVLAAYVSKGVIVMRQDGDELPTWRSHAILRSVQPLTEHENVRVGITETGAKAFETGRWNSI